MAIGGGGGAAQAQGAEKTFGIDFIDPLFAVAIHIGLVEGIMREEWFIKWRPPQGQEMFDLFVFLLGMTTLVLSWVGYHQSILARPLKGLLRFVIDVALVLLYAVMLVKFHSLGAVLFLLAAIYSLFVVWDFGKLKEYRVRWDRRESVTVLWCAVFWVLWLVFVADKVTPLIPLMVAFLSIALYRINKAIPMWGNLGNAAYNVFFGSPKGDGS